MPSPDRISQWNVYLYLDEGQERPSLLGARSCIQRVKWPLVVFCEDGRDAVGLYDALVLQGFTATYGESFSLTRPEGGNPNDY